MAIADSWTMPMPEARRHRPGVGPDFTSGDVSIEQYAQMGNVFAMDRMPGGLATQTDAQLFEVLRNMAQSLFTTSDLKDNTNKMIDKFKAKEGGDWSTRAYSNPSLTKLAKEHDSTKRFVKAIRDHLAQALAAQAGDAGKLTRFADRIPSPVYNSTSNLFDGLTIAVNDTWAFEVYLTDYEMTSTSDYRATVKFIIYDHFGLDPADITGWEKLDKALLAGFRAWFLLQHVRGYRPFVTKIEFEESFEDRF
jgi:hypothetical protein